MACNNTKFICNDEFEIIKITEDQHDQVVKLYQKYFMKYETLSIACELLGTQQSIDENEILIRFALNDGISFAARHCETQQLAAMCINKMLNPSTNCNFDEIIENHYKSPSMLCVADYLKRIEGTYDLYKKWNIDCCFEILFLSTRSDFECQGLATHLAQYSIDYARKMLHGTLPTNEKLPVHVRDQKPKAVCSIFTSYFSQRIAQKLGFRILNKISHKEFTFNGKTFAEKIDPIHEYSMFEAIRL